jgi:hypothetical protein
MSIDTISVTFSGIACIVSLVSLWYVKQFSNKLSDVERQLSRNRDGDAVQDLNSRLEQLQTMRFSPKGRLHSERNSQ